MTSILPPTALPPANPLSGITDVTPIPVAVLDLLNALQLLERQVQVGGVLAAPPSISPDATTITMSTALGEIMVKLPQLATNELQALRQQLMSLFENQKPVTLVIQPGEPPQQAMLLLPANNPPLSADTATNAVVGIPLAQPLPPVIGTLLSAVVLPPDFFTASSVSVPLSPNMNPASMVLAPAVTVPGQVNITIPAAAGQGLVLDTGANGQSATVVPIIDARSSTLPLSANQTAVPILSPAVQTGQSLDSILTPGQQVSVRLDAVMLPAGQNQLPPTLGGDQIAATVVGKGVNGELIVQAGNTNLFVRQPVDVPVGTNLLLMVAASKSTAPLVINAASDTTFASLEQIMAALAQNNPPLAQQINTTVIPQPNAQLPGTLLFFLNALQRGDFQGWLGSAATNNLPRAGKMELLSRLTDSIKQATQILHDATVGEWKLYPLPMQLGHNLHTLNLYVHQDRQAESDAGKTLGKSGKIRFLIDVHMSRLGSLQLDGLVHPKKLDMIMRSEHPLPAELLHDLRVIYTQTIDAMGYTGGLGFQAGRQNWLSMNRKGTSREI